MSETSPSRFCILSTQRSGSTWLVDVLNRQEGTRVFEELFNRDAVEVDRGERFWGDLIPPVEYGNYVKESKKIRLFRTFAFLKEFEQNAPQPETKILGFKLMYSQLKEHPELLFALKRGGYKIVHQVRGNLLDLHISMAFMVEKQRIHQTQDNSEIEKITLEPTEVVATIRAKERKRGMIRRAFKTLGFKLTEITYEDMKSDLDGQLKKLAAFLDTQWEHVETSSQFKRVNPGSQRDKIANPEEVSKALRDAGLEHHLDESMA